MLERNVPGMAADSRLVAGLRPWSRSRTVRRSSIHSFIQLIWEGQATATQLVTNGYRYGLLRWHRQIFDVASFFFFHLPRRRQSITRSDWTKDNFGCAGIHGSSPCRHY